jgi:hypothetical protein
MNENQKTFSELREIIFWQQINRQLIELRNGGKDIRDEHQKYIQLFSLDNLLFSKITGAALLDDVPMGLITDLSEICFINLKLSSWNRCLAQLISHSVILDIEQALADSFDALGKYDKKYYLGNKKNEDDEDDEELCEFIEKYLDEREKQGGDIANVIKKIYELKSGLIQGIMESIDYKPFIVRKETRVLFDFSNSDKKSGILENYLENFCRKAVSIIDPIIFLLTESNFHRWLLSEGNQRNLKPSIKTFLNHETDTLQKEADLLRSFSNKVHSRINLLGRYEIGICDLSPFSFLDSPFPLV